MNQDTKNAMAEIFAAAQKGISTDRKSVNNTGEILAIVRKTKESSDEAQKGLDTTKKFYDGSVKRVAVTDFVYGNGKAKITDENPEVPEVNEESRQAEENRMLEYFVNPVKPTKQSEIEGNQKIAIWLGGELSTHTDPTLNMVFGVLEPSGQALSYFVNELAYHKDWNHLMMVADRIHDLIKERGVLVTYHFGIDVCVISYNDLIKGHTFHKVAPRTNGLTMIENARLCILEFIDWHNLLPK